MVTWYQARVLHGEKTGRTIGFPTVNLDPSVIPQDTEKGIYASLVKINGKDYHGVLYFGPRLVKNETHDVLEIHVLEFAEEIYGDEISFTLEKFVRELLPVLDSLELGISVSQDDTDNIEGLREGMSLTLQKFSDTLQKFGVSVVDPVAEKFNPERHEAVTMQAVEGTDPGMVAAVMQKGYELNGRLVRPAMVIVAR